MQTPYSPDDLHHLLDELGYGPHADDATTGEHESTTRTRRPRQRQTRGPNCTSTS
jgi:hypothetical protein